MAQQQQQNPQDDEAALEEEVKALQERLEDKTLYCVCLGRDDGTFMICCDKCENWYHGRCVNIKEKEGKHIDKYICPNCSSQGKGHTTYKGLGKRVGSPSADSPDGKRQRIGPSREERREKALEEAKRRHEERQRQRQLEEAERLLELAEQKKKQEQEEKVKRQTTITNLKAAMEEGFKVDREANPLSPEIIQGLKKPEIIAKEIEEALYTAYGGISIEYLKRFRSLVWNLKDKKNTNLRTRVFQGDLDAFTLVRMDSQQLANKELIEYRKEREKISFDSVYKKDDTDARIYRKTHKGIEDVEKDLLEENELNRSIDGLKPEAKPSPLKNSGKGSNLVQIPEAPVPDTVVPKVNINIDLGVLQDDALAAPLPVVTEPEPASPPGSPNSQDAPRPPSWEGRVVFSLGSLNVDFHLSGFHINGVDVEQHVPLVLNVNGRIPLDELLRYLPKLDVSSTRQRTCVYFEPSKNDEDKTQYKTFFAHLRKANRGGVVSIDHDACVGVDDGFFKEIYIFPLAASAHVPSFLGKDYDRDLEDMLIGVFISNKNWKPKPKPASTTLPAPVYQYNPPPSSTSRPELSDSNASAQVEDMDTAGDDSDFFLPSSAPTTTTTATSNLSFSNNNYVPTEPYQMSPSASQIGSPRGSGSGTVTLPVTQPSASQPSNLSPHPANTPASPASSTSAALANSSGNANSTPAMSSGLKDVFSSIRGILSKIGAAPPAGTVPTPTTTTTPPLVPTATGDQNPQLWAGANPVNLSGIGLTGITGLSGLGNPGGLGINALGISGIPPDLSTLGLPPSTLEALGLGGFGNPLSGDLSATNVSSSNPRGGGVRRGGTFAPRGRGRNN